MAAFDLIRQSRFACSADEGVINRYGGKARFANDPRADIFSASDAYSGEENVEKKVEIHDRMKEKIKINEERYCGIGS
jgi:hypothetical protein